MNMKLSDNYRNDLELVIQSKDKELLKKFIKRITLPGPAGGPLITYEEQARLTQVFGSYFTKIMDDSNPTIVKFYPEGYSK